MTHLATQQALNALDTAIQQRIQREKDFIAKLVLEFKSCVEGVEQVASSASPQVQANLQPYIDRLQQSTQNLKTLDPLPEGVNVMNLAKTTRNGQAASTTGPITPTNTSYFGGPTSGSAPDDDSDDDSDDDGRTNPSYFGDNISSPHIDGENPEDIEGIGDVDYMPEVDGGRRGGWKPRRSTRRSTRRHSIRPTKRRSTRRSYPK